MSNPLPFPLTPREEIKWGEVPFNTSNLLLYCLWYGRDIYVRHFNKDTEEFEPTSINDISGRELLEHMEQWIYDMKYPHRIIEREEPVEKPHE